MQLNKTEKEKLVIELYNKGKTIREIAKEVHMSFGDISIIIKKFTGEWHDKEEKDEKSKIASSSTVTQSLYLFSQKKTPLEVAINLNLIVEEVERNYENYWRLKGLHELYNAYEKDIKNDFPLFLEIYKIIKEEWIDEKGLRIILQNAAQLKFLGELVHLKNNNLKELTNQINVVYSELDESQNKLLESKNYQKQYQDKIDRLTRTIKMRNNELKIIKNSIDDLKNDKDYSKIIEIIQENVISILNSKEDLIIAALTSVLYVWRNNPDKSILTIDPNHLDYQAKITSNSANFLNDIPFKKYIKTHYECIIDIANIFYEKIIKIIKKEVRFSSSKI